MVFVHTDSLRDIRETVNLNQGNTAACDVVIARNDAPRDLIGKDGFRTRQRVAPQRIGYVRVSTDKQLVDRQVAQLRDRCDELRFERVSAVASKRPVFDQLIRNLGPGDTFVVLDLDRAFRSAIDALLTAQDLRERGIGCEVLSFPVDVNSEIGEVFYGVLALFARFERRIIRRRTVEGLQAAKARGVRLGRPPRLSEATVRDAHAWIKETGRPCRYVAALLGVHRLTLQRSFRRMGLTYPITGRVK